jgi:dimethylhistidine N-methyltransferase
LPTENARVVGSKRLGLVEIPDGQGVAAFAEAVRLGLGAREKTLPCRYFYDEPGSQLFERICELPEYYLTRTEDAILRAFADAMLASWDRAPALIELGSGSSTKTQRLIAAGLGIYGSLHYYPIDVSATILEDSARALVRDFPRLRVTAYVADYRDALEALARTIRRPKCLLFLGSSLGNYEADEAADLLAFLARIMGSDDRLLLGTDLVKEAATLEAAYDDAHGVTAEFNRNLLHRINRELGADFVPDRFDHRARYRADWRRVEMHLISRGSQVVTIPAADLVVRFRPGEAIHTENSHKYTTDSLGNLADRAGFVEEGAWTDEAGLFRVQRWRPA